MESSVRKNLSFQDIALFFTLYTTQFLALAFFTESLIAILRESGVSLESLGLIYMLGLFWIVRFLWAPLIDSIAFKWIGHYKGWIIIFQTLMVLTLILNSFNDVFSEIEMVIFFSMVFAFSSASQNIALDAIVLKTVSLKDRAFANGLKSSGGLLGSLLGAGFGLILYEYFGWQITLNIIGVVTFLGLIQIIFYKELKDEKYSSKIEFNFRQYIDFWRGRERKIWLFFLLLFPISISSAYGLLMPLLVDLDWRLDKIGFYVHILGFGIGVIVSLFTSWFIKSFGKIKVLIVAAMGQFFGISLLLLFLNGYTDPFTVTFVVGFIFSFYAPSNIVMTTLMMDEACDKNPAAQFAIQQCIYMFSGTFFAGISISFAGVIGYHNIILFTSVIAIITVFTSYKIEYLRGR